MAYAGRMSGGHPSIGAGQSSVEATSSCVKKTRPVRQVSGRPLASRFRLLVLAADDSGVRSWEVEIFKVTVVPSDEERWLPILMAKLENRAVAIRLARLTSMNHDSVTNGCVHDPSIYELLT